MSEKNKYVVTLDSVVADNMISNTIELMHVSTEIHVVVNAENELEAAARARHHLKGQFEVNGVKFLNPNLGVRKVDHADTLSDNYIERASMPAMIAFKMNERIKGEFQPFIGHGKDGPMFVVKSKTHNLQLVFNEDVIYLEVILIRSDHQENEILVSKEYSYPIDETLFQEIEDNIRMICGLQDEQD